MNILVTGANGQLGRHLHLLAPQTAHTWHFTDLPELDITDSSAVRNFMLTHSIDLVINCAAYTNVEAAQQDYQKAFSLNAVAVENIANMCSEMGAVLVHISTDYVFGSSNNTPLTEAAETNALSVYGATKLAGEKAAARCRSIVLRTSWLYSEYGRNFLLTMRRLTAERAEVRVVFDQVGSPTYAGDLARAIVGIIEHDQLGLTGLYHYSSEGMCSWYDFAYEIAHLCGHTSCRVLPCHSSEYPTSAERPAYSVLDKTLFKNTFHQEIPHWSDGLRRCLSNL